MNREIFELSTPVSIEYVGFTAEHAIHRDRILNRWVLGIVTRGTMFACIGDQTGTATVGEYYLMPPQLRHYGTKRASHDAAWFEFQSAADGGQSVCLPPFGATPPGFDYGCWSRFIRSEMEQGSMTAAEAGLQVDAILAQLLAEHRRHETRQSPTEQLAHAVFEFLLDRRLERLTRRELESEFGYSYSHLDRVFRASFGTSALKRFEQLRMDEAATLLRSGRSIKEAASVLGYEDYYYFLKVFKRVKGVTPSAMLRSMEGDVAH